MTPFEQALKEFLQLEAVDTDWTRLDTIDSLVYSAQFEIDLVKTGESTVDVREHRRFVRKWSLKP